MTTKLINGTSLQLLRRYDNRPESYRAQLLDDVIFPHTCLIYFHNMIHQVIITFFVIEILFGKLGMIFFTLSRNTKCRWILQDGPAYVRVFVSILRDIFKEETVEYVLALIDEMLTGNSMIFISTVLYDYVSDNHQKLFK